MKPIEYVNAYLEHAKRSELRTGVPALFSLAQSALESGWSSAKPGNMMFGIKATSGWHGKKQLLVTREVFADALQGHRFPEVLTITPRADGRFDYKVRDWFRAYDSPAESFDDHGKMLRGNSRYARCFETTDPREFARRIAAAGYATDPNYAQSLIGVIATIETAMRQAGVNPPAPQPSAPKPAPVPSSPPPAKRSFFAELIAAFLSIFKRA